MKKAYAHLNAEKNDVKNTKLMNVNIFSSECRNPTVLHNEVMRIQTKHPIPLPSSRGGG